MTDLQGRERTATVRPSPVDLSGRTSEREREREKREERERERDLYEKDAPSTVTKLNSQTKLTSRLQQGTSICEGRTEHCN